MAKAHEVERMPLSSPRGAVPESLRKPRSCRMQATTMQWDDDLRGTKPLTTRTTPNNTKHPPQPPSPLTHRVLTGNVGTVFMV